MTTIHGAASYELSNEVVELAVTLEGGQMAPVKFRFDDGREVSPYALAPWLPDEVGEGVPALLRQLRGDFWCFPFGAQADGPPHGETANGRWERVEGAEGELRMRIAPRDVGGEILKIISLRAGQTAVYIEHRISGVSGRYNYGTHPILDCSALAEGGARLSVSPFRWASVYPGMFSDPGEGARGVLQPGGEFGSLAEVPLAGGGTTDLTRFPARGGSDDLVMMVNDAAHGPFAWSAAVMDGYVWFALKNPRDFPATLFWLSNGGRSAEPWSGRHRGRVGIEEVCSHFCDGVEVAREERLASRGVATSRAFDAEKATRLAVIHAVAPVAAGFGRVVAISPGVNEVVVRGESGAQVRVAVDWDFVGIG